MSSLRKFPALMVLVGLVSVAAWGVGCGGNTAVPPADAGSAVPQSEEQQVQAAEEDEEFGDFNVFEFSDASTGLTNDDVGFGGETD